MPGLDGYEVLERDPEESPDGVAARRRDDGVRHDGDAEQAFASGADDYVRQAVSRRGARRADPRPAPRARLRRAPQPARARPRTVVELTQTLASHARLPQTSSSRSSRGSPRSRASIAAASSSSASARDLGYVVAASDDEQLRDLPIDLAKYPEIQQVLEPGATLVIRGRGDHPLLEVVRQTRRRRRLRVARAPAHPLRGTAHGRALPPRAPPGALRRRRAVARSQRSSHATAIALRNARILQYAPRSRRSRTSWRASKPSGAWRSSSATATSSRARPTASSSSTRRAGSSSPTRARARSPATPRRSSPRCTLGEVLPIEEQKRALAARARLPREHLPAGRRRPHPHESTARSVVLSVNFSSVLREEGRRPLHLPRRDRERDRASSSSRRRSSSSA